MMVMVIFENHHRHTISSAYATLRSLNSLKFSLSTKLKLQLVDSLIFSRLTYCNVVTYPVSKSWSSKYNKMFKTALSFAFNKYISTQDLSSINILNMESRWKLSLLSLAYKSLYFAHFPSYLALSLQNNPKYALRSSSSPLIVLPSCKNNTFQDNASAVFNSLPDVIRDIQGEMNFSTFKNKVKSFLLASQQKL